MKTLDELTGYDKAAIIFDILGDSLSINMFKDIPEAEFYKLRDHAKNLRNDVKNCEYFNVINITNLDDSIKKVIEESYNIRDKNKKLLKSNHPKINEILGFN